MKIDIDVSYKISDLQKKLETAELTVKNAEKHLCLEMDALDNCRVINGERKHELDIQNAKIRLDYAIQHRNELQKQIKKLQRKLAKTK